MTIGGEGWGEVDLINLTRFRINKLIRVRRQKTAIMNFAHYLHAAGSFMQGAPNFQQNARAVGLPLTVPKAQHHNSLGGDKSFTLSVMRTPMECCGAGYSSGGASKYISLIKRR